VLVISPNEGVRSRRTDRYCERVAEGRFAVGLELSVGAERKRETSLAVITPTLFNNLQVGVMARVYPNHSLGGSAALRYPHEISD